jgi:hydrogenase-4 component F
VALTFLVFLPLLAAFLCWIKLIRRGAWAITVVCLGATSALAFVVTAKVISNGEVIGIPRWFEIDGLGSLILVLVTIVCFLAAVFAGGYMRHGNHAEGRLWWFYCNYNLLAFALIAVPALADPNLVWVAVELVTLFSVLLVSFDNTAGALEAAWKFSVLTIMGAPIALLGFFSLFWAYHTAGATVPETWQSLRAMAPMMSPQIVKFSFLLVFVGFGAKTGIVPMHTWLPDAHSQAPSPICAVLSGIKTSVPLYVILRLLSIVLASPGARIGTWMVSLGLVSVAIAAFLLIQVRDYKRMFAYSTVEHMGIILAAAGFATHSSDFGAVAQLLNHAITKSVCFYVAGTVLLAIGTREIKEVRGLFRLSPFAGGALLLCALAITGAPPFPIFLSEFSILSAGIRSGHTAAVAILATLIVIAFIAIMFQVNRMLLGKPDLKSRVAPVPLSCRTAVLAGIVPIVLLGVFVPAPVHSLLQLAAQQLGGH